MLVSESLLDICEAGCRQVGISPRVMISGVERPGCVGSLDTVELVMALEEEFEIDIPDEAAEKISTVQSAVDFIVDAKA